MPKTRNAAGTGKTVGNKKAPRPPRPKPGEFYIVGIGASAGGLEAFERFFQHTPDDTGMAFVLVPHLDPTHVSLLPSLIQKFSKMVVTQAEDGVKMKPNSVYIVPPNYDIAVLKGSLQLMDPPRRPGPRMSIDYFFRSMAQDLGSRAICVVLSGMGTDGTLGLRAVKGALGMVMAQAPESARYDSMPRSAIATELVDYILPPEKMPARLVAYTNYASRTGPSRVAPVEGKVPDSLKKIFILLRSHTGHDFSSYKKNTIYRRIERRMNVHQVDRIANYVRLLQEKPAELTTLFKELLIGVTSFFRDTDAFEALSREAFPLMFDDRPEDLPVRIWAPGCSTGEEAYSLAICLREYADKIKRHFAAQIFATDLDTAAVETARLGMYSASIAGDMSPERLRRYFVSENGMYRIKKDIREMLVFAAQDLIKDPPFTKLDMICCRNLLIYMDGDLQKKLIPLFHYSIRPGGVLFLGPSESIGTYTDLFSPLDRKWKLYRRADAPARARMALDFPVPVPEGAPARAGAKKTDRTALSHVAEKLLLANFAPPSVIVDEGGDILFIHGRTGKFLEPAPGEAKLNIHDMAREGLRLELASAMRRARTQARPQAVEGIRVPYNGGALSVKVTVRPVNAPETGGSLLLVVFEETTPPVVREAAGGKRGRKAGEGEPYKALEKELQLTKENLQTTIEELETSNEELKSTNEELQSTNEELQSSNEELETSKEEQQSLNEELTTVNSELQGKIDELIVASNDMKNLLNSINVPTIFLDMDLHIKRFTSHATRMINLIQTDIGRPLGDLVTKIRYERLIDDARDVLRDLVFREREVETTEGNWYSMKILPYRTVDNVIDGVVITFQDMGDRKRLEHEVLEKERECEEARRHARIGGWRWTKGSAAVTWSAEMYTIMGRDQSLPPIDYAGQSAYFTAESWERKRSAEEQALLEGGVYEMELERAPSHGAPGWVLAIGRALTSETGEVTGIEGTVQDITETVRVRRAALDLANRLEDAPFPVMELDVETGELRYTNRAAGELTGPDAGREGEALTGVVCARAIRARAEGRESVEFTLPAGPRSYRVVLRLVEGGRAVRVYMSETGHATDA